MMTERFGRRGRLEEVVLRLRGLRHPLCGGVRGAVFPERESRRCARRARPRTSAKSEDDRGAAA